MIIIIFCIAACNTKNEIKSSDAVSIEKNKYIKVFGDTKLIDFFEKRKGMRIDEVSLELWNPSETFESSSLINVSYMFDLPPEDLPAKENGDGLKLAGFTLQYSKGLLVSYCKHYW